MEVLFHLLIKLNAAGALLFSDIALHEVGFLQPGKSGLKCLSSSAFMIAFALSLSLTYFPGRRGLLQLTGLLSGIVAGSVKAL